MKQGSSVHKVLEEQAVTVLPVDTIRLLVERILQEELKAVVPAETINKVVQKALDQEKRTAVPLDVVGGLVHQVLEKGKLEPVAVNTVSEAAHKITGAQVQKAVSVEIETKEDAFGLKIWNIIQNLRTLRVTGQAREFETWAVIEGQVVNGIIDELSYECPDEDAEAELARQIEAKPKRGRPKKQKVTSENQTNLDTFFSKSQTTESSGNAWLGNPHANRTIYLKDVKTRGSKSMPKGEASFRPTQMQLMMYHRMLSLLASNSVPAEQVFARYALDSDAAFSDMFIAQLGSIESDHGVEAAEQAEVPVQDPIDELLAHNSLEKLWTLMISEFQLAIPFSNKPSMPSPIGDVLMAEYRASGSGSVIGSKTFVYDSDVLDTYLKKTMAWWNGERMPNGVEIEEAFKCRMCEFAEVCSWRKDKVEEGVRKARLRNQGKKKSDV
jgi:exonuclease V